jgi:hypothetical protein
MDPTREALAVSLSLRRLLPKGGASNLHQVTLDFLHLTRVDDYGKGGADPKLSAFQLAAEDPVPLTTDKDPVDRRGDRLMAYLGLLDDAAPLFRSGTRVSGAGVLLALPALVQSGVFQCAREIYGSIGPAFYGLRTSILALLLMALLRIKRPEGLKEHPPGQPRSGSGP